MAWPLAIAGLGRVPPTVWAIVFLAIPVLQFALFLVLFGLELAGHSRSTTTAVAAGAAAVPALLAGLAAPPLLPYAVVLVLLALNSHTRVQGTEPLPEVVAFAEARERFRARRTALGRHYRWRIVSSFVPYVVLGLVFALVLALSALTIAIPSMFLGPIPNDFVGLLQILIVGPLVLLGLALLSVCVILGAVAVTPLSRAPVVRLLRALWPEREIGSGVAIRVSALLAVADLLLFTGVVVLVVGSALAIVFPGVAGGVSLMNVLFGSLVFLARLTLVDVAVLTSGGKVGTAVPATWELVLTQPGTLIRSASVWVLGAGGVVVLSLLGTWLIGWSVTEVLGDRLGDGWTGVVVALTLVLTTSAMTWAAAPLLLFVRLFRLATVDELLRRLPAPEGVDQGGGAA